MKHAAARSYKSPIGRRRFKTRVLIATGTGFAFFCTTYPSAFAQTGTGNKAASQPAKSVPSGSQIRFPASDAPPNSFIQTPPSATGGRVSNPLPIPLSRVWQDAQNNSDATRGVNLITSAFPIPRGIVADPNAPIWLGTQYGVKRVEKGRTRYYTPADGLPGVYVEAVTADTGSKGNAKSDGAWCLARADVTASDRVGELCFCAWDLQTDSWRTLSRMEYPRFLDRYSDSSGGSITPEARRAGQQLDGWRGRGQIAQSIRYVAFAPSLAFGDSDAIAYLWDKKAQKLRPINGEPAWRNRQTPFIGVSFLYLDDVRETLWLGTSRGLLAYSLTAQTWRTVLPNRFISAGAVSTGDKNALYITARVPDAPRPPASATPTSPPPMPTRPQSPPLVEPCWRLVRVALPTGEATELPTPPLTRTPKFSRFGVESYRFSGGYDETQAFNEPVGLFMDEKKAVWATLTNPAPPSYGSPASDGPGGIERYDPGAKTWEHFALTPARPQGSIPSSAKADTTQARLDTVPIGALVPLMEALQWPGNPSGNFDSSSYNGLDGWQSYNAPPPAYWISHRVPHWYGANDDASILSAKPYNGRYETPDTTSGAGTPGGGRVWFVDNSDTLASVPVSDSSKIDSGSAADAPNIERYPLEATFGGLQPSVRRMISASQSDPAQLLVQTGASLYLVDANRKTWSEVKGDTGNNSSQFNALFLPPGANAVPLMQPNNGGSFVRRWNAATSAWETAANLGVPQNSRLLGPGADGAVWFTSYGMDGVWYVEPTPPDSITPAAPVRVPLDTPEAWTWGNVARPASAVGASPRSTNPARPFAAWGRWVWCKVLVQTENFAPPEEENGQRGSRSSPIECLAGYNTATKKWTKPLPLPRNTNMPPRLLFSQSRIYAATTAGNPNGGVWEWNQSANTWDVIAPALPPEPTLFDDDDYYLRRPVTPVAVDARFVWTLVQGRMMARYDRAEQKWEAVSLPAALRTTAYAASSGSSNDPPPAPLQINKDTFCLASETGGLWQMHLSGTSGAGAASAPLNAQWEPLGKSILVRSRPNPREGSSAFYLNSVTVTPRFVWVVANAQAESFTFAARLDKETKTWTTWDENSGFPLRGGYVNTVTADGDAVWINTQAGTYRFDPEKNRWVLTSRDPNAGERGAPLAARRTENAPTLLGQVARIAPDANVVYVLLYSGSENSASALLWQWERATKTLTPLPFPDQTETSARQRRGAALLNEPDVVWVGTSDGLWAWDKTARTWSRPPLPPSVPAIIPNALARKDSALLLFGYRAGKFNETHTVRLNAPPFLKRP